MSLPQGKRDFIRKLVTGVSSVMEFDKLLHSTDETDVYIKKHFEIIQDLEKADVLLLLDFPNNTEESKCRAIESLTKKEATWLCNPIA